MVLPIDTTNILQLMNMINKNLVTLARNGLTKHLYKNKFVLFEIFQQIQDKIQKQIEKILKHKDLENQLANAKFEQSELKLAEFVERTKKDRQMVV